MPAALAHFFHHRPRWANSTLLLMPRKRCSLVTHGGSLPLDESEKEKAAAGAAALRWSR
jgi:hypothetical protein